ncbi:MAG: NAD(P)-dependent oxidoreductase [bacterium]|nr:NAD(P)-dependent oxidoreductase [bacterium]
MVKNIIKTKKVLILGASGMLAADLIKVFSASKKYALTAWGFRDLDITNEEAVKEKIGKFKPDIIINAAAYTAVDQAEKEFDKAMAVNGYALKNLAEIASETGACLVHYSTDYVFDGKNPKGYKEDSEPNPVSAYGQSKFVGEQMISMTAFHNSGGGCAGCGAGHGCDKIKAMKPLNYYIIRSSWLYGKNGKNFVDTMVGLAAKHKELKVVKDQRGSPTFTVDLAKATKDLIEKDLSFGIYHFTNKTPKKGINWYDFAREIFKIKKIKVAVKPVTTKEFYSGNKNYLAKRPAYSMLINTKLPSARNWKEALKDYLKEK